MPIGWVNDAGLPPELRETRPRVTGPVMPWEEPEQWEWQTEHYDELSFEIEYQSRPQLYYEVWERWLTASDERTCPECAPLAGLEYREGEGPRPPLHGNCRCEMQTFLVPAVRYESVAVSVARLRTLTRQKWSRVQ